MKLTKAQATAIAKLRATTSFPTTKWGSVVTGVNTTVLYSLREFGLVTCKTIFLRGHASNDFAVVPDADVPAAKAAAEARTRRIADALGRNK